MIIYHLVGIWVVRVRTKKSIERASLTKCCKENDFSYVHMNGNIYVYLEVYSVASILLVDSKFIHS